MDIRYKIALHSYWHCGSGLAAGGDADALVIKDSDGLPFIPGKTIKGLVKEAAEEMLYCNDIDLSLLEKIFGTEGSYGAEVFFSNASIEKGRGEIVSKNLQEYMYSNQFSTSIEKSGTAKDSSLRKTEVAVPCELEGLILNVPEEGVELIKNALSLIKRIGFNRNRGLGRCTISVVI